MFFARLVTVEAFEDSILNLRKGDDNYLLWASLFWQNTTLPVKGRFCQRANRILSIFHANYAWEKTKPKSLKLTRWIHLHSRPDWWTTRLLANSRRRPPIRANTNQIPSTTSEHQLHHLQTSLLKSKRGCIKISQCSVPSQIQMPITQPRIEWNVNAIASNHQNTTDAKRTCCDSIIIGTF